MSSAPTGLNPYSQGQRPWIGLDVESALKGRNTSKVISPFQGSLKLISISQGVALGFMDSAPLGLVSAAKTATELSKVRSSAPKGLRKIAQGCGVAATLGSRRHGNNPKGVA
uniref:Uncharacterized protein n=1 Tax=Candidatus Kentrum sp. DK TaxID=2126562 RepID=A0A450T598_9GAMM|nr:MAG: hypothetical protein BECKDK2373B_GA0170837_11045 [Candidatus Kentron sp. DK]